jgi:pilus assembly protein FimV
VVSVALASSLILLSSANATGLGKLTVLSALGQPLRAEIELTSPDKDEIGSLLPRLASVEAFRQSSIDFNPALLSLRFAVEPRGTGYVIRVTSAQSMNEPFVDLLLEMNSSNGKLLREYTFLLDPAELRNSQSAQVASPINVTPSGASSKNSVQARPPANSRPVEAVTQKSVIDKPTENNKKANSSADYQVRRGDTLTKIANEYMGDGISLDQMLLGLYKANPQAFSGDNMNRLKSGQILSIPDVDTIRANTQPQAHLVVRAHAADFASYRNKLAGQVADAPAQKTAESKQTVGGSITAKIKEVPTATSESLDKLKLSKAAPGKAGVSSTMSEEDLLAKDRAVAEANARVKELEKNVGDLQKLLAVKNKDFAEKQSAATLSLPSDATPSSAPAVAASAAAVVPPPVVAATPPASVAASAPAKRRVLPPPPPAVTNWYDNWSDWLLPLTGVIAVLGLSGLFLSRRKKKTQQFDDSVMTGSSMKANSMFGSTGGQSVDTNNSVFNSNFAPSASQLDANEVDPVAEADVYIAYGRDSQAEEILKEALRIQPDRHAVRVKLLEIYFSRKDPRSFERLASELYGMTNGEGEEWAQAASMGVTLEPTNPLYAGGKSQAEILAVAGGFGMGQQTLDELDPEALLGNSLSQDMLDSIGIMDTASGLTDSAIVPELDFVSIKENSDEPVAEIGTLDFDLNETPDTQSNELPIIAPVVEPVPEENIVADFGLIDFDFGEVEAPAPAEKEEIEIDHSKKDSDSVSLADIVVDDHDDIKFESSAVPASPLELDVKKEESDTINSAKDELASTQTFDFDLSGIDLDLDSGKSELDLTSLDGENAAFYNAEMATKLDLAVAYQEIGDKEGARELLDEVLKDGTPDQIEKAQKMLLNLG